MLIINQLIITDIHYYSPQIETHKTEWKAKSKIKSLDNASHVAGGGDKKVSFMVQLTFQAFQNITY